MDTNNITAIEPELIEEEVKANTFEESLTIDDLLPKTKEIYLGYYRMFGLPQKEFNQSNIQKFIYKHNSNVTRAFLRKYKDFLLDNGQLTNEQRATIALIRIKKKTGSKKEPHRTKISPEEFEILLKNIKIYPPKLMLLLAYFGGLRISELLKINGGDSKDSKFYSFNWEEWLQDTTNEGKLKVIGKREKERIIPLHPTIMKEALRYFRFRNKKFKIKMEERLYRKSLSAWKKYLKKISKKYLNHTISSHAFRRGRATWMLNNGYTILEVRDFLGHSDIATTQLYVTTSKETLGKKVRTESM